MNNNTVLTVYPLLKDADAQAKNGLLNGGSAPIISEAFDVFSAVNTLGGL